jgi:hypothetical protein
VLDIGALLGAQQPAQPGAGGLGLDFDSLGMDFGEESAVPAPSEAIELVGEDFRKFHYRFRTALNNSKTQMKRIHEDAENDRKVYRTIPRKPLYEGGPDVTTPLSADFVDGLRAHIKDAIEQRPMVAFTPEGMGRTAEEATEIAPVYEAYLEREINRSGSRQRLANDVPDEAVITGTAITKLGLSDYGEEVFVQVSRLIRLENFFVDRVTADDLRDVFCAYRYKERYYNLEDDARRGLLDLEAVQGIRSRYSSTEEEVPEEHEQEFVEDAAYQEENSLHTLYCGYMKFRPTGSNESKLYECIYHENTQKILAIRTNPAAKAFNAPPLDLVRVGKQPGYLFGRGVVRRLEAEQKIADRGINNHLAMNDMAASPPVQYNVNNPIAAKLAESRVLEPNMWIPTYGPPDKQDIHPIQIPNNGLSLGEYGLAIEMAQRQTYTDEAIGQSGSTRKTLGQFRTEVAKGTLKLRLDLSDISYDMAAMLMKMWSMVVAYKIDPNGIVMVDPMGKLLGNREIDPREVQSSIVEIGSQMLMSGELTLDDAAELDERWRSMLTQGRIPSAKRHDLVLSLSGTKIIADKIGELETELQLLPIMLNLIQGAAMDTYINHWGRSILRKAGLKDIEKRWPADPGEVMEDPAQRFALMQQLNQVVTTNSTAF